MTLLTDVLSVDARHARLAEEAFFRAFRKNLHQFCTFVATQIDASGAAVFFATEEATPPEFMVMRGADGPLKETFATQASKWSNGLKSSVRLKLPGFSYRSALEPAFLRTPVELRDELIREWPVTCQMWHQARGRVANSNRAMDELKASSFAGSQHAERSGAGDIYAYPGRNLYTTFRNMLGVPIFAEGGGTLELATPTFKPSGEYPTLASPHAEFLSRFRVVGILKIEGKLPQAGTTLTSMSLWNEIDDTCASLSAPRRKALRDWCKQAASDDPRALLSASGRQFPRFLLSNKAPFPLIKKRIADAVTHLTNAVFTRPDMELVVLLAMQIGRLYARRVMKYASTERLLLSENEVGALNIRWSDIGDLVSLMRAAEAAVMKLQHHLNDFQRTLDLTQRKQVFNARVSDLLESHGAVRRVGARKKNSISLISKLVRKENRRIQEERSHTIVFPQLSATLKRHGHLSGDRNILRGDARLYIENVDRHSARGEFRGVIGADGQPQLELKQSDVAITLGRQQSPHTGSTEWAGHVPLVMRILSKGYYAVDDLAAGRIIADYLGDVEMLLDFLRDHMERWGLRLRKVDDQRNGAKDGYRAVHLTYELDVSSLVGSADRDRLSRIDIGEGNATCIPVEIQLLTSYQDSWARKTHDQSYKRQDQIPHEQRDVLRILSNVLHEADHLSDVNRGFVKDALLPPDYGERRLLEYLRPRLSREDYMFVLFACDCTKEVLRNRIRYNGLPEYSFAMEICERLVYGFDVTDGDILVFTLLRNIWHHEGTNVKDDESKVRDSSIEEMFCRRIRRRCPDTVEQFRRRLKVYFEDRRDDTWVDAWTRRFPGWFWAMQRSYHQYRLPSGDARLLRRVRRLEDVYEEFVRSSRTKDELSEWLERAIIVEAAILLADLLELPVEPGRTHKVRVYNDYLIIYRQIRKYLPNGELKVRVDDEINRAFRQVQLDLDIPRESEWWGE